MTTTRCPPAGRRRPGALAFPLLVALGAVPVAGGACGGDRADPMPTSGGQAGISAGAGPGGDGGHDGDGGAGAGVSTGDGGAGQGGQTPTGPSGGGSSGETGAGGGPPICFPADGPLGSLEVVTVDAGACGAPGGSAVDVATVDEIPGYFDRLVTLGTNRIAGGEESFSGPIWLDLDGSSPGADSFFPGGTGLAVRGDVVAILGDSLAVQRFGADRAPIGAPVTVGAFGGGAQGIAPHGDGWIVAWVNAGDVVARRLDGDLAPTEEAVVVEGSGAPDAASMALRSAGDRTAIAYAAEVAGDWRLTLAVVGDGYGDPVDAACGHEPIRVVDVESVGDGWVVLTRNRDAGTSHLVRVGADGLAVPPAVELAGAPDAYGMRRSGDALGVVAELATGQPALRTFDAATLEPLGGWSCLAGAAASGWAIAIDADAGGGFAVLHANEEQGLRMTRTDATGEGP